VAVCRGQTILPEDLGSLGSAPLATARRAVPAQEERAPGRAPAADLLRATLERHQWRRHEAAAELGVSRSTLWRWMRERSLV